MKNRPVMMLLKKIISLIVEKVKIKKSRRVLHMQNVNWEQRCLHQSKLKAIILMLQPNMISS